jgi:hypothetical protein
MSRTYKKHPYSYSRSPKGKRSVMQEGDVRPKAIPPDDWDDLQFDKQVFLAEKVAKGLWNNCYGEEDAIRHLRDKFKLEMRMAEKIVFYTYEVCDYCWSDKNGTGILRVADK